MIIQDLFGSKGSEQHRNVAENHRRARLETNIVNQHPQSKDQNQISEGIPFDQCPRCGGSIVHQSQLTEKQDACYHKVKSRYKVWPSAYASGALVQCRKKGAANWGNKNESANNNELDENLRKWFDDKWVRFGPDGKIKGDCARGDSSEGKPKCLPQSKAHALGKKGRASAGARKRRQDPDADRKGAAINVATKKKSNEDVAEQTLLDTKCWDGYKKQGTKMKDGVRVNNCVPQERVEENTDPRADPYNRGYFDALSLTKRSQSPYPPGSDEDREYHAGFESGYAERREHYS
jgi:hypothetical protein